MNHSIKNAASDVKYDLLGGNGPIKITGLVPENELSPKTRMLAMAVLEKGCSVGSHPHVNETEYFHIISGEGLYTEDSKEYVVYPGDTSACGRGSSHAIENKKDEPLVFLAIIITD